MLYSCIFVQTYSISCTCPTYVINCCKFDSVKSRMATGYLADGSEDILLNLGWAAPAGQMYSTVNDLMKVLDKKVHRLYAFIQLRYKAAINDHTIYSMP